jgi:GR25 family glycosyltransferase involved in LPS biosynthesis
MSVHTDETIDLHTYKYTFTTYATQKFLPSLHIWLNIHTKHAQAVGGRVVVWLGADVQEKEKLAAAWPAVEFRVVPSEVPAGSFADFWAAEHYAWKIWLMKTMTDELSSNEHEMVLYVDAGAITIRVPTEMMTKAAQAGACFVEDTTQKNMYWFSDSFKRILNVQEFEMHSNQIQAATIVFVPSKAKAMIGAAYTMACNRDIIAGPKWAGVTPTGQPVGHRHDQAIFSLLHLRHGMPVEPIGKMQNIESMKVASETGVAFYVHRGNFVVGNEASVQTPKGLAEINVINLERRADRLAKFYENHPELKGHVRIHKATDGRALQLTPAIARLLRPNDFFWKKAIAGCALSHLGLWHRFATAEGPDDKAFLVFEDDVKLKKGWQKEWNAAVGQVPANWDVLYLGGVLPQNWAAFDTVKERVSGTPWCRVAPNQIFGQRAPTRYFHFCNYSYVISKRGAQKLLSLIQARDGFFTSADHMICNHVDLMNLYFLDPKVAGCTQEDDPAYMNSQFNNYNRIDTFDSDLWTNDERWSVEERDAALKEAGALDIGAACKEEVIPAQERNLLVRMIGEGGEDSRKNILESEWLEEMLNCNIWIEPMVQTSSEFKPKEVPWIIVSRQDLDKWKLVFKHFESEGRNFYAIHLSDEYGRDDISWYSSPMCKGVIRNYWRADAAALAHVIILPLGYTFGTKSGFNANGGRTAIWSFEGTSWFGREEKLAKLSLLQPNEMRLFAKWNDPGQKSRSEYAAQLSRSIFVPILRGNNIETFRMYEALESGAVPIYVREPGDEEYWDWFTAHVPLANITSWSSAAAYMKFFLENPAHLNKYRNSVIGFWKKWKTELRDKLSKII